MIVFLNTRKKNKKTLKLLYHKPIQIYLVNLFIIFSYNYFYLVNCISRLLIDGLHDDLNKCSRFLS